MNTSDTHAAAGTATPIPIPAAGTNYSYWVVLRPDATVTPVGTVSNGRWFTDGSNSSPAGVTWKAQEATAYVQSTGTSGTTGLQLTVGNYATLTGAPVDPFSFTSAAPKTIAGSIASPSTGPYGSWLAVQLEVASTTGTTGAITAETYSYVYDAT